MRINRIRISDLKKNKRILRIKKTERLNIEKFRNLAFLFIIKFTKKTYKKIKIFKSKN